MVTELFHWKLGCFVCLPFGKGYDHFFFFAEMLQYYIDSYISCLVVLLYFAQSVIISYHVNHFLSD